MIPTPKLPTDNLYKFVALFGLTLVIVGTTLQVTINHRLVDWGANLRHEQMLDSLMQNVPPPRPLAFDTAVPRTARDSLLRRVEISAAAFAGARERLLRDDSMLAEMRSKGPVVAADVDFYMILVLQGIGTILIIAGFGLWYERVQNLQDELLRLEVADRRRGAGESDHLAPKTKATVNDASNAT